MILRALRLSLVAAAALGWLLLPGVPSAGAGEILDAGAVTQTALPNGLRVVVKEAPDINLVVLNVWVRAGSSDETEESNGVSHFLEHLMFKGTKKRGPLDFQKEIEGLGGLANATSMQDATQYYVVVSKEHFAQAAEALGDVMANPAFPAQELQVERGRILDELAGRADDPENVLSDWVARLSFRTHPYRLPNGGTPQSVRAMTREKIVDFYQKHYVAANMSLVVVGAVKAQDVLPKIGEAFGGLRPGSAPERTYQPEPPPTENSDRFSVLSRPGLRRAFLMFGFRAPGMATKEEVCAMDVLLYVLGEQRAQAGRLNRDLRQRLGVVSSIYGDYTTLRDPGLVTIWAETEPNKVDQVRQEVLKELARARDTLVPDDEIQRAKQLLLGVYTLDNETYDGQAGTLGFYEAKDTYRFALEYAERIRKVTAKDVQDVARKYLGEKSYSLAVLTPNAQGNVALAPIVSVPNEGGMP